jgi:DNA/RNA-binding domain of Phe-tRNA-synthetase-like protein
VDGSGFPPVVHQELAGWTLAWFDLWPTGDGGAGIDAERARAAAAAAARFADREVPAEPVVAAVRRLFREAGCDPTRYRPSSEALLRRVLKHGELPAIHPLVDLNNVLSLRLLVPCCVVDAAAVQPPFTLRAGGAGEVMDSMRGLFGLEGKPLIADLEGPFGTPITDSERVKIGVAVERAWVVAYLPSDLDLEPTARTVLVDTLGRAPVARLAG